MRAKGWGRFLSLSSLACGVALASLIVLRLRFAPVFAHGCIRISETEARLGVSLLFVAAGLTATSFAFLCGRLYRHRWRVLLGSTVAALTFIAGVYLT